MLKINWLLLKENKQCMRLGYPCHGGHIGDGPSPEGPGNSTGLGKLGKERERESRKASKGGDVPSGSFRVGN